MHCLFICPSLLLVYLFQKNACSFLYQGKLLPFSVEVSACCSFRTGWRKLYYRVYFISINSLCLARLKPRGKNGRVKSWWISRGHFFIMIFFRVAHDGLSERGTTRSLLLSELSFETNLTSETSIGSSAVFFCG